MAMIKIISNPYDKDIQFYVFDKENDDWSKIDTVNYPNSRLLKTDISKGFFPFVVKKIVDIIIEDYRNGDEPVSILFEGTRDEYAELESLCSAKEYKDIVSIEKSSTYLENARDILDDIRESFGEITPLIKQIVSGENLDETFDRFDDATSSTVPICVVGNYSSGKSTFINSLIGNEILPSGDKPVTARIFKIVQGKITKTPYISFDINDVKLTLKFDGDGFHFSGIETKCEIADILSEKLKTLSEESLEVKIKESLEIINNYESDLENPSISDLIEISLPFKGDVWGQTDSTFIIFDTPGSNSASNERHLEVLKKAMYGLTNGLPIFVSEYKSLDSVDNENLYKLIRDTDALDDRFTMIIVNKADDSNLPDEEFSERDEKFILHEAVPKKLYSEGIYFVSSIMGLGAKTNGKFIDKFYERKWEKEKESYSDENDKYYTTLYRYNIMPAQLKQRFLDMNRTCEDKVYANSGLYSVEKEILTFVTKYSSYNKCRQSCMYLDTIIDAAEKKIAETKARRESNMERLKADLDKNRALLISELEKQSDESKKNHISQYEEYLLGYSEKINKSISIDEIQEKQKTINEEQEDIEKLDDFSENKEKAADDITDNLVKGISNAFKTLKLDDFKLIGSKLKDDLEKYQKTREDAENAQDKVNIQTDTILVEQIKKSFIDASKEIENNINTESRKYWTLSSDEYKNTLIEVVAGAQDIPEKEKQDLKDIIISYDQLNFEDYAESVFKMPNFKYLFKFGDHLIGKTERVRLSALENRYNAEIESGIVKLTELTRDNHEKGFRQWAVDLIDKIEERIVEINPDLKNTSQLIRDDEEEINKLKANQAKIERYNTAIKEMMNWKNLK